MLISNAYAQAAGGAATGPDIMQIAPLVLIFAVFYFLLIRPQQKKIKEHKGMVSSLRRGDKIVTGGGIIGEISKVEDNGELTIEVSKGVKIKVIQETISTVISKTEPVAAKKANKDEDSDGDSGNAKGLKGLLSGKGK